MEYRSLAATPSAPGWARRLVVETLTGWGLTCACDTMRLVVSELVTNSVNALEKVAQEMSPQTPVVRLRLTAAPAPDGSLVTVETWDQVPSPPIRRSPGAGEEHGRGLLLVEAVTTRWGWYWPARPLTDGMQWPEPRPDVTPGQIPPGAKATGKVTWAQIHHQWTPHPPQGTRTDAPTS
ncbi:hypothetical protein DPM19_30310 [Actinomadura craniellae]|uniref:ATP-binding protein n=1 Tax=Actinomadura craniellae TaxID=2231787 RepID=A0A365GWW5_9ACTN|nr:hypothetical protein DPM19_30310 [Actinomadura craniellae]